MPIHKFTNSDHETVINVKNRKTIRILSASFSKGFEQSTSLDLVMSFPGHSKEIYSLNFDGVSIVRDSKQKGLSFYRGNGAVFTVADKCREVKLKVSEKKSVDYEFVLTYDFYPGSI